MLLSQNLSQIELKLLKQDRRILILPGTEAVSISLEMSELYVAFGNCNDGILTLCWVM